MVDISIPSPPSKTNACLKTHELSHRLLERKVKHDAIVKQGTNRDKIVYTQLSNIKEKRGDADKLRAPTADEEALTAERTRLAFEKVEEPDSILECHSSGTNHPPLYLEFQGGKPLSSRLSP